MPKKQICYQRIGRSWYLTFPSFLFEMSSHGFVVKLYLVQVFSLAVFGPIPNKEDRVVNAAYEMICADSQNCFENDVLNNVFDNCVNWIVDPCQQFSIKLPLEWLLVRLAVRSSKFRERVLNLDRTLASKRTGSVCSWINMVMLLSRSEGNEVRFHDILERILPWATAQNFAVRCTAVAAVRLLYTMIPSSEITKWKLLEKVIEFSGESSGNSQRIICDLVRDFYFGHLNPLKHFDLQTILLELPKKTGMPPEEIIPVALIKILNSSTIPDLNHDEHFLSAPSQVYSRLSKSSECAPEIALEDDGMSVNSTVQRKVVTEEKITPKDYGLIVVASLVDKPANLGGLCRTCEIFGVDALVLADHIFVSDPNFKALSMSSEKKQRIEAIRPENLSSYLESMRKDGYTVIAAEQTTDSVFLHKFQFPLKTVLLVGDEKEGVPVHLLRCVDKTVEIKQLGQTRSLNVHVSAALFVARYAEQVLFS
uniref:SpoU_methylase domain-containing protein n=1 Tax=Angiostrongylus cantonensis TaxID=6313 RepID=A0A158P9D7_ANGCA